MRQVKLTVVSRTLDKTSETGVVSPHGEQATDCRAQIEQAAERLKLVTPKVARSNLARSEVARLKVARSKVVDVQQALAKVHRRCLMRC